MIDTKPTASRNGATTADVPPRHRQCTAAARRNRRGQVRVEYLDGVLCPSCGRKSVYSRGLDRYVHLDGSDSRDCWLRISRGEPLAFDRESQEAWDDAVHRLRLLDAP
jgi:hypothetical protein